jgi:endonuclease/exonuclease/phosphatase family metal-dependent hydrolase
MLPVEFVKGAPRDRVLAIVPATATHFAIFCGWAWAMLVFQPYGQRFWALMTVSTVLVCLLAGLRFIFRPSTKPPTGVERVFGRSFWLAKSLSVGAFTCTLGLVAWSELSPGGPMPPAKSDPTAIRVVTWNILHGTEQGTPWSQYSWPVRKNALRAAIVGTKPDVLCVQEALSEQLRFLADVLPQHRQAGVGRDDGRSGGEHCAILFDGDRFEQFGGGTFWLEAPTDQPPTQTFLGPKRICTWVRLQDRVTSRSFRVYNVHQYMTESARLAAVRLILPQIDEGDPSEAMLVAGDFNAQPDAPDRLLFEAVGFRSSGHFVGLSAAAPTYQFYGIRLRNLDDILVNRAWRVLNRRILDVKPENTFPSDHFGVMADLIFDTGQR